MSAVDRFIKDADIYPSEFPAALLEPETWEVVAETRGWTFGSRQPRQRFQPWSLAWNNFYFVLRQGASVETALALLERLHEIEQLDPVDEIMLDDDEFYQLPDRMGAQ